MSFANRPQAFAIAVTVTLAALAAAPAAAIELRISGGETTVYSWARQRCETWDVPDAPARAFRDADGRIRLLISHVVTRAMVGPSFAALRHDCGPVFAGARNDDPDAFDDRLWLTSVWTRDGTLVHGLAHAEYHGQHRPDVCPAADYMACWNNAVVQVLSTDGGRTFARDGGAERAPVATLPWRYDPSGKRPTGYFAPSNIIEHEGHLYAFVFAARSGVQGRGACLLRTPRITDPQAWRAWDGRQFSIDFVNPALTPAGAAIFAPERHVCAPVAGLPAQVGSVVRHAGSGDFIAVFTARLPLAGHPEPVRGVFWAQSPDLLRWSPPRLLHAVATFGTHRCADGAVYSYPSLIDEASPSRTFDTVGRTASLYLTRLNPKNCRITADRDLVRLPVTIDGPADSPADSR
ncbi:MAG: DUF4185 domain-containing protein [Rhodospirillales bacterium]|nr:DUF4185 domain-containing protein [Rhodospirillales bacterium]